MTAKLKKTITKTLGELGFAYQNKRWRRSVGSQRQVIEYQSLGSGYDFRLNFGAHYNGLGTFGIERGQEKPLSQLEFMDCVLRKFSDDWERFDRRPPGEEETARQDTISNIVEFVRSVDPCGQWTTLAEFANFVLKTLFEAEDDVEMLNKTIWKTSGCGLAFSYSALVVAAVYLMQSNDIDRASHVVSLARNCDGVRPGFLAPFQLDTDELNAPNNA